jgi:hypothetical protein
MPPSPPRRSDSRGAAARELPAPRRERPGNTPAAARSRAQEEAREVRASDEEHEADGAEKALATSRVRGRRRAPDRKGMKAPPAVGVRVAPGHPLRDRVEPGLELSHRSPFTQAGHPCRNRSARAVPHRVVRNPQVVDLGKSKPRRHDPDDLGSRSLTRRSFHNGGVAAESALPESIAQDRDRLEAGRALGFLEVSVPESAPPQEVEEVGSDEPPDPIASLRAG